MNLCCSGVLDLGVCRGGGLKGLGLGGRKWRPSSFGGVSGVRVGVGE